MTQLAVNRPRRRSLNGGSPPASKSLENTVESPIRKERRQSLNGGIRSSSNSDLSPVVQQEATQSSGKVLVPKPADQNGDPSPRRARRRSLKGETPSSRSVSEFVKLDAGDNSTNARFRKSALPQTESSPRRVSRAHSFNGGARSSSNQDLSNVVKEKETLSSAKVAVQKPSNQKGQPSPRIARRRSFASSRSANDLVELEQGEDAIHGSFQKSPEQTDSSSRRARRHSHNGGTRSSSDSELLNIAQLDEPLSVGNGAALKPAGQNGDPSPRRLRRRSLKGKASSSSAVDLGKTEAGDDAMNASFRKSLPGQNESSSRKARRHSFNGAAPRSSSNSDLSNVAQQGGLASGKVDNSMLTSEQGGPSPRRASRRSFTGGASSRTDLVKLEAGSDSTSAGSQRSVPARSKSSSRLARSNSANGGADADLSNLVKQAESLSSPMPTQDKKIGASPRLPRRRSFNDGTSSRSPNIKPESGGIKTRFQKLVGKAVVSSKPTRHRSFSGKAASNSSCEGGDSSGNNGEKTVARRRSLDLRRPLPPRDVSKTEPAPSNKQEASGTPENRVFPVDPTSLTESDAKEINSLKHAMDEEKIGSQNQEEAISDLENGSASCLNNNKNSQGKDTSLLQPKTEEEPGLSLNNIITLNRTGKDIVLEDAKKNTNEGGRQASNELASIILSQEGGCSKSNNMEGVDAFCAMEEFFSSVCTKLQEENYKKLGFTDTGKRFFVGAPPSA